MLASIVSTLITHPKVSHRSTFYYLLRQPSLTAPPRLVLMNTDDKLKYEHNHTSLTNFRNEALNIYIRSSLLSFVILLVNLVHSHIYVYIFCSSMEKNIVSPANIWFPLCIWSTLLCHHIIYRSM